MRGLDLGVEYNKYHYLNMKSTSMKGLGVCDDVCYVVFISLIFSKINLTGQSPPGVRSCNAQIERWMVFLDKVIKRERKHSIRPSQNDKTLSPNTTHTHTKTNNIPIALLRYDIWSGSALLINKCKPLTFDLWGSRIGAGGLSDLGGTACYPECLSEVSLSENVLTPVRKITLGFFICTPSYSAKHGEYKSSRFSVYFPSRQHSPIT